MTPSLSVGVVAKPGNDRAIDLATKFDERLRADDVAVDFDETTATTLDRPGRPVSALADCDFVVSLGGDGTLLYVVRAVGSTPVVGVDLGEVGLLATVDPDSALETVSDIVRSVRAGTFTTDRRRRVVASGDSWEVGPALNEVLVQGPRRGPAGGVTLSISLDEVRYTQTTADGVLVATPSGSTAYNLSEGGPFVHPAADVLVLTTMADSREDPPLVLDAETTVSIDVAGPESALVIADGSKRRTVETPATITVETASEPARLAGPSGDFVDALGSVREDG